MNITVFGASGLIGSELASLLAARGHSVTGTYFQNKKTGMFNYSLQESMEESLKSAVEKCDTAVICCGLTDVILCEENPLLARHINVDATIQLIETLQAHETKIVFLSTDMVFDGRQGNYIESDPTQPRTVYGETKESIEKFLLKSAPGNSLIIRLSKVIGTGPGDGSLAAKWLKQISHNELIRCTRDQFFCPTCLGDVVHGISLLIESDSTGIYHLCHQERYNRPELLNILSEHLEEPDFDWQECCAFELKLPGVHAQDLSMSPVKFIMETGMEFTDIRKCLGDLAGTFKKSADV